MAVIRAEDAAVVEATIVDTLEEKMIEGTTIVADPDHPETTATTAQAPAEKKRTEKTAVAVQLAQARM